MTTRAERAKFAASPVQKFALDQFWLDLAGNRDFARRVIKAYYENVEYANEWFSDYREGWKSDRGMVLIIFGKPNFVQRTGFTEAWFYDEKAGTPALRFSFDRKQGSLGQTIWELRRTEDYSNYWYITVDQWRKGIVRR
jgi:GWxTD domain-containing protein